MSTLMAVAAYPDAEVPFNDEACFAVCDLIRGEFPAGKLGMHLTPRASHWFDQ